MTPQTKKLSQTSLNSLPTKGMQAFLYGKLPPQNIELEKTVLGAIMLERGAFDIVKEVIQGACFYEEKHRLIFEACDQLNNHKKPIDLLTVAEQLKADETLDIVGGIYYLTELTQDITSTANIEFHARVVLEKYIQRELMSAGSDIITEASAHLDDIADLMTSAEDKIFNITQGYLKGDFKKITQVLSSVEERIMKLKNSTAKISGIPSNYPTLDHITHGWQPTDLIILAARPSVGKTAFALNLALNATRNKTPIGFFSLEMSSEQLVQRLLANQANLSMGKITSGNLRDDEIVQMQERGIKALGDMPIYIDDTAALNSFELRSKVRRMVNKHNVGMVIIDYLQLMQASGDKATYNREQEISRISRDLKSMAKDLQIPIIALSQLNRSVELRKESKIPQLSDLRESGAIEQDADMVMFLYRPELYDQGADENSASLEDAAFLKIAKHRNGDLTDGKGIQFKFDKPYQRFEENHRNEAWQPFSIDINGGNPPNASLHIQQQSNPIRRSSFRLDE